MAVHLVNIRSRALHAQRVDVVMVVQHLSFNPQALVLPGLPRQRLEEQRLARARQPQQQRQAALMLGRVPPMAHAASSTHTHRRNAACDVFEQDTVLRLRPNAQRLDDCLVNTWIWVHCTAIKPAHTTYRAHVDACIA